MGNTSNMVGNRLEHVDEQRKADAKREKALLVAENAVGKIEHMEWDCDGEVYDALCRIMDFLA